VLKTCSFGDLVNVAPHMSYVLKTGSLDRMSIKAPSGLSKLQVVYPLGALQAAMQLRTDMMTIKNENVISHVLSDCQPIHWELRASRYIPMPLSTWELCRQ